MSLFKKSAKKASARRQIDIKGVQDGILILPGNKYRAVLKVSSVNFELKSEAEQDPKKICSVNFENIAYKGPIVSYADTNNPQTFDKTIQDEYDVLLSRAALIKKTEVIIDKDGTKSQGVILDAIKYHTDRNMVMTVQHDSILLIDASSQLDLKENGKKVNYLTFIASSEKVEPEAPEKTKDYVITDNKATQYIYKNFRWIK